MDIDYTLNRLDELRKLDSFFRDCEKPDRNPNSVAGHFGCGGVFFGNAIQHCSFDVPLSAMKEIYQFNKDRIEQGLQRRDRLMKWVKAWNESLGRGYIPRYSSELIQALSYIDCDNLTITKLGYDTVFDFTVGPVCKVNITIKCMSPYGAEFNYTINGKEKEKTYQPMTIVNEIRKEACL